VCDLLTYQIIVKFKPRRRKMWVREWIKRRGLGASSALCRELSDEDEHGNLNFLQVKQKSVHVAVG
jgi:hypothetical protein